jgi:hypothetical protein
MKWSDDPQNSSNRILLIQLNHIAITPGIAVVKLSEN